MQKQTEDAKTRAVEAALYRAALHGDTKAMIFWLSNRAPTKWREHFYKGDIPTENNLIEQGERILVEIKRCTSEKGETDE